jgi:hypothetical protein
MLDVHQALPDAARGEASNTTAPRRALVVGAGGRLGSAVIEQLLATQRFERVAALVERPIRAALREFVALDDNDAALAAFGANTAIVVFDRARASFGREAAFVRPAPPGLPALARRLLGAGVSTLIVAVPHTPSLLPTALQLGLASLDEAAVAALGFEQLVFMRMAQDLTVDAQRLDAPHRLAHWMLSQLRWMIPQREQPVRAQTVAQVAAALAVHLPEATPGTRVLPAATMWQAAQGGAPSVVRAWLAIPQW